MLHCSLLKVPRMMFISSEYTASMYSHSYFCLIFLHHNFEMLIASRSDLKGIYIGFCPPRYIYLHIAQVNKCYQRKKLLSNKIAISYNGGTRPRSKNDGIYQDQSFSILTFFLK